MYVKLIVSSPPFQIFRKKYKENNTAIIMTLFIEKTQMDYLQSSLGNSVDKT